MEATSIQPNPLTSLLPMLILMIPMIFIIRGLAKAKGKDLTLWTVLACIPIVNFIVLPYIVGVPSKIHEDKMDKIMEELNRLDKK
jgi:hypothetical protein